MYGVYRLQGFMAKQAASAASLCAVQCYQIVLEQVKGMLQDRMSFSSKCTHNQCLVSMCQKYIAVQH